VIARAHHLHDDRLFDCYIAERAGEALDPPAAEHLLECPDCAGRFNELAVVMDDIRAQGEAEADELFTAERLRHQHQQILQRVEHYARPARVISFPGRVSRRMVGATTRVTPRWIAAAAAAGLFVGVAVGGAFFQGGTPKAVPSATMVARSKAPAMVTPQPVRITSPAVLEVSDDDRFLSELEWALQYPLTSELMPFDALTPHVRDVSTRLR
jgi:hypothetical protein